MAVTPTPVFPQTSNVGRAKIGATANTNSSGTGTAGTDIMKAFTAGANGSHIDAIMFIPVATSAATATTATTLRAFISTVSSGATTGGTDTFLIGELTAASQTADHSTTAITPLYLALPTGGLDLASGDYIYGAAHVVNAANTHWQMVVYGRDY